MKRDLNLFGYRTYAGIGSRETPMEMLGLMTLLGFHLALQGWTLRSGGAPGADTAFEMGAINALHEEGVVRPEIYLPWEGFEDRYKFVALKEPQPEAVEIAKEFHPAWDKLRQGGQKLMGRNVHQMMGPNVNKPTYNTFVICWTPGGKGGGGTGQALRIAKRFGPQEVYDLGRPNDEQRMRQFLRDMA